MEEYHYIESGLDNVFITNMPIIRDDHGEEVISIPNINMLHKVIAKGLIMKQTGLTGKELRFLRTEVGKTQAELAILVHREPLTIGRWERGEKSIESTAETVIRHYISDRLKLDISSNIEEISRWCVSSAVSTTIQIDGSDPKNYHQNEAA